MVPFVRGRGGAAGTGVGGAAGSSGSTARRVRPALVGRGDGSGGYLVPTDVPPTTSPRPEGAALLVMLTRQRYPRVRESITRRRAERQRDQAYGVVVEQAMRPERSRMGREKSVESLCMRVRPAARAECARAAVSARYMPRPRHSGTVAPPQRPAKSDPATGSSRPADTIRPSASATQSSMPSSSRRRWRIASARSADTASPKTSSCMALIARTSASAVTRRSVTPAGSGTSTASALASPSMIDSRSSATNPFARSIPSSPGAWSWPRVFHSTVVIAGSSR